MRTSGICINDQANLATDTFHQDTIPFSSSSITSEWFHQFSSFHFRQFGNAFFGRSATSPPLWASATAPKHPPASRLNKSRRHVYSGYSLTIHFAHSIHVIWLQPFKRLRASWWTKSKTTSVNYSLVGNNQATWATLATWGGSRHLSTPDLCQAAFVKTLFEFEHAFLEFLRRNTRIYWRVMMIFKRTC